MGIFAADRGDNSPENTTEDILKQLNKEKKSMWTKLWQFFGYFGTINRGLLWSLAKLHKFREPLKIIFQMMRIKLRTANNYAGAKCIK